MPTVYLIRHGSVEHLGNFNGPEEHLSDRGRADIEVLARRLRAAGVAPGCFLASPFTRTQETAQILSDVFALPFETETDLEEWRVGAFLGKPLAEFYAATHYNQDPPPDPMPEGVEPLADMAERVIRVIRDCVMRAESSMLVSHREPIVSAMLRLEGKDFSTIHRVSCEMGAVWKVEFDAQGRLTSAEPF